MTSAFAAKALATAIVTQLFSYMVGKGIQYGFKLSLIRIRSHCL
jgi:hypothetical protein